MSCYIITTIHLPVRPRQWFCCLRIREKSDHYTLQELQAIIAGVGESSLRLKKIKIKKSPSDSQMVTVFHSFPYCCKYFFNFFYKCLMIRIHLSLQTPILYHCLFRFKIKTKLLTFCPEHHPCFPSPFFTKFDTKEWHIEWTCFLQLHLKAIILFITHSHPNFF